MTFEEWAIVYPPIESKTKPTNEQTVSPDHYRTYRDAVTTKDWFEDYHQMGGLLVVKYEEFFYVVYGQDYLNGFKE